MHRTQEGVSPLGETAKRDRAMRRAQRIRKERLACRFPAHFRQGQASASFRVICPVPNGDETLSVSVSSYVKRGILEVHVY